MIFWIHPVFQSVGILVVLYTWYLGMQRFRKQHLRHKNVLFQWKRHVRFGLIGSAILLAGICGGLYVVKTSWYAFLMTGLHGTMGICLIPFIVFAMISGLYMDRRKKKRKLLPLLHALLNTVMLMLALSQIYTGIGVYQTYVLGY